MNDVQEFIHKAALCYLTGRILTIFYKKSFSLRVHSIQFVKDCLPISLAIGISFILLPSSLGTLSIVLSLLYSISRQYQDELLKTLAYCTSLYIAFCANFTETTYSIIPLFLAGTQFLRKPEWLKEYIREPRIIFGPIYVIMISAGLRFCSVQRLNQPTVILTILPVMCSVIATVFLRPDNSQVLRLVLPDSAIPSSSTRRLFHGFLLFASHVITFFKVAFLMPEPSTMETLAAVAGGLSNIFLFILYKVSSR